MDIGVAHSSMILLSVINDNVHYTDDFYQTIHKFQLFDVLTWKFQIFKLSTWKLSVWKLSVGGNFNLDIFMFAIFKFSKF